MPDNNLTLSTGRILPEATVVAHQRTIEKLAEENWSLLYRLFKFSDRRLADHLVEAELIYLHDLGLIEADGRLHPDFHDVLVSCLNYANSR